MYLALIILFGIVLMQRSEDFTVSFLIFFSVAAMVVWVRMRAHAIRSLQVFDRKMTLCGGCEKCKKFEAEYKREVHAFGEQGVEDIESIETWILKVIEKMPSCLTGVPLFFTFLISGEVCSGFELTFCCKRRDQKKVICLAFEFKGDFQMDPYYLKKNYFGHIDDARWFYREIVFYESKGKE